MKMKPRELAGLIGGISVLIGTCGCPLLLILILAQRSPDGKVDLPYWFFLGAMVVGGMVFGLVGKLITDRYIPESRVPLPKKPMRPAVRRLLVPGVACFVVALGIGALNVTVANYALLPWDTVFMLPGLALCMAAAIVDVVKQKQEAKNCQGGEPSS